MTREAVAERERLAREWLSKYGIDPWQPGALTGLLAVCANEALEKAAQLIECDDPEAISKTWEDYADEIRALKGEQSNG